jgi:hypothetical protein
MTKNFSFSVCQSLGEVEDLKAVLQGRTWQKFVVDIFIIIIIIN